MRKKCRHCGKYNEYEWDGPQIHVTESMRESIIDALERALKVMVEAESLDKPEKSRRSHDS